MKCDRVLWSPVENPILSLAVKKSSVRPQYAPPPPAEALRGGGLFYSPQRASAETVHEKLAKES